MQKRPRTTRTPSDWGYWLVFFFILYIILLLKLTTRGYLSDNFFFAAYSVIITIYILSRFLLSFLHRSFAVNPLYEPTVSFVVPAKNEEDNIYETIRRFGVVQYPPHKVEVIVINDGSTDNTLFEMKRAAADIRSAVASVEIVDWQVNRGKRHGMAEGAKRARGEIVIFVDSDSFIEPDAVRHLVKYFADPRIGAVSGHTDVYNRDENVLTRMQALRYYVAFKIYKAAESVFGIVTCCPGCCSAYRRAYIMPFIDEWLHQKFFGKECTFGDDRSLTNFIIRDYLATYSPEAKAYTVVPDTFAKYRRQQQRWKKSWLRETFIASSFMWEKNPFAAVFFYTYMFLAVAAPIVFIHALIWNPLVNRLVPLVYLGGLFLMLALHGVYYRVYAGKRPWLSAVISFWFYSVILMWQLPWAAITLADTRWGTR